MAKKTLIVDDLTGDAGARSHRFALDGEEYEIDLIDAHFAELKAALKPYVRAGRPARGSGDKAPATRRPGRTGARAHSDAADIRAWARSHGMAVTERGRVTADLRAAWIAAGSPR